MDNELILYFLIVYGVVQILLLVASAAWIFRIRHDLSIMHAKIWDINNDVKNVRNRFVMFTEHFEDDFQLIEKS